MRDTVAETEPAADAEADADEAADPGVSPDAATAAVAPGRRIDVAAWRDRLVARVRVEPALVVLAAAMLVWFVVFARLVWHRHEYYATFDFDLGHHDQAIWLLSRGTGFITVSGMPVFGHHFTPAYLAVAPFYWLGAGPQFLNVVQNLALAASAIPIYLYARDKLSSSWLAVGLGVAWLLNPSMQWLAWETWHPETVAIPFLLTALLMASRKNWRWYWVFLVAALAWKEDLALAVAMIGVVMLFRRERRIAMLTLALAAVWFIVAYQFVMPHFNGGTNHAGIFYGELGESPTDLVRTFFTHPDRIYDRLDGNDALGYGRDLALPFAFAPLLSPAMLLVAAPQFFANALTNQNFFYDIRFHYVAVILVAFAFGAVDGAARFRRPGGQRFAVGAIVACALATSVAWGMSPISTDYRTGYWPLNGNARQQILDDAVASVPGDAAVAASYYIVPHLSHRRQIYTYPNPWIASNWGVMGDAPNDPDHDHVPREVEYLVVDRTVLGPGSREIILLDTLLANGEFRILSEQQGVVVARRAEPPTADPPAEVIAQTPPTSTTSTTIAG